MTLPTSLHIHERGTVHDPDSNASFDAHRSLLWPQGSSHDTPKFSEEILHAILSTRKSWKTLKGQAEAVWPPYLEATMLKGAIPDRFSNPSQLLSRMLLICFSTQLSKSMSPRTQGKHVSLVDSLCVIDSSPTTFTVQLANIGPPNKWVVVSSNSEIP